MMTVGVFSFVLLLVNALKEVLPVLVSGEVSPWIVAKALALLLPFALVFALPMGMLTATLLIFGRFSADQELTAARASGVSLLSLSTPVLLLSLALCVVCASVNMEIGPRARVAYTGILDSLKLDVAKMQLPEGRFLEISTNYICYVGKNEKGNLSDIRLFQVSNQTNVVGTVRAKHGTLEVDEPNKIFNLVLRDGSYISAADAGNDLGRLGTFEEVTVPLDPNQKTRSAGTPRVDDMTFFELREELRRLERMDFPISRHQAVKEQLKALKQEWNKRRRDMVTPVLFQMHRQAAFSFACFGFTLVGIPLAIRVHRRETNIGIAVALLLVAVYYMFILIAQSFETRAEYAPYLIVWMPNFVFQVIGVVMLSRANRGV